MDELQPGRDLIESFWDCNSHILRCNVKADGRIRDCGWYLRGCKTAFVNPAKCRSSESPYMPYNHNVTHVMAHEVGHHVWMEVDAVRPTFGLVKKIERSVSPYRRDSASEQFCETFALFVTNPSLLQYGRPMRFATLAACLNPAMFGVDDWRALVPDGQEKLLTKWKNDRHCS